MNEALEQQINLSSRKRRIAAFMIDHFVMTFLMVSIVFIALGPNFMDENNMGKMTTTMLAVMLPGFLLYFAKDSIKPISCIRNMKIGWNHLDFFKYFFQKMPPFSLS